MNQEAMVVAADMTVVLHAPTLRTPLYAIPPKLATPLRVVLVAPRHVPAWLLRFLELVPENQWLELVVLPVPFVDEIDEWAPPPVDLPVGLRALLAYERRRPIASELAPVTIDAYEGITFETAVRSDLDIVTLPARISALCPDLVLLIGVPQWWAERLGDRTVLGCWDLDPSLIDAGCAAQALLAPVMRGEVATAVELQLHHHDRPPTTLATSWGATCRTSASVQREQAFRKIPALLMRSLRQLANGELHLPPQRSARLQLASPQTPAGSGAGLRTFASTLAFRFAARGRRSQSCETARHIVMRHAPDPIDPEVPDFRQHSILSAPRNRFWADPCVVEDAAGRNFLFVEQWADIDNKGVIACLELLPNAQVQPLGVALDRPFYLSCPQPFRWQGQWYMTVGSGEDKCVSLYRADAFPLRWQHVTDLITGWIYVDPTLQHHGNHWYLFANVAESGGSTSDELFLFVADSPMGPFRPHPANPIVSDARRARSAGRLFHRDGRLIRPAQDCARGYGAAVVFNEVLELSPTRYRECPLGRLDTRWESGMDGCHTYNAVDGIEVLEARGTPLADSPRLVVLETPVDLRRWPGGGEARGTGGPT